MDDQNIINPIIIDIQNLSEGIINSNIEEPLYESTNPNNRNMYNNFIYKFSRFLEPFIIACKNLTSVINDKISKDGLLGLYKSLNTNEKMGFNEYYSKGYRTCYDLFNIIYKEVESGNEIKSVINTNEYLIENKISSFNILRTTF